MLEAEDCDSDEDECQRLAVARDCVVDVFDVLPRLRGDVLHGVVCHRDAAEHDAHDARYRDDLREEVADPGDDQHHGQRLGLMVRARELYFLEYPSQPTTTKDENMPKARPSRPEKNTRNKNFKMMSTIVSEGLNFISSRDLSQRGAPVERQTDRVVEDAFPEDQRVELGVGVHLFERRQDRHRVGG